MNDTTSLTYYFNGVDATLAEDYFQNQSGTEELYASAGNRLSDVPESSHYISLDRDFYYGKNAGYFNIDYSYTGDRPNDYGDGAIVLPSYSQANLRAGLDFSNTSVEFYVNNLFDKNGYLSRYDDFESVGDSGYAGVGIRRTGSKPRVVGIRFRYRY